MKIDQRFALILILASLGQGSSSNALTPRAAYFSESFPLFALTKNCRHTVVKSPSNVFQIRAIAVKMRTLGIKQSRQNQWNLAERNFLTVLHLDELVEDTDDKTIQADIRNLIDVYLAQGKYSLAEPLIERFFKKYK